MASAYKVGTISEILAKEAGGVDRGEKKDPRLVALFGGAGSASSKVFRTVKVNASEIFKKEQEPFELTTSASTKLGVKKKKIKLGNKDAASIRVEAKRKINMEQVEGGSSSSSVVTKKMKVGKKQISLQDETISTSTSTKASSPFPVSEKKAKQMKTKHLKKLTKVMVEEKEDGVEINSVKTKKENKLKKKKERKIMKEDKEIKPKIEDEDDLGDEKSTKQQGKGLDYFKTLAERNAPKAKDPELEARTIFVGNIPGDTKKKQLKKLFLKFGSVETVRLRCGAPSKPTQLKKVAINKRDLHSDKRTVAAYVRFKTRGEAEKAAAEARGLMINDNHLIVDLVIKFKSDKRDNKKAIFVGNLNLKLTDEELWRFFEDCGKISAVRIIRDNQTGLGKGFGFVNFEEREAVAMALKKNEQELKNREIRVTRHIKKMKIKKGETTLKSQSGDKMQAFIPGHRVRKPDRPNSNIGRKETRKRDVVTDELNEYMGDRLAEIGKLKRKSNKPNKGELRKAKIAKLLTGKAPPTVVVSSTHAPNCRQASFNQNVTNKKRYFN